MYISVVLLAAYGYFSNAFYLVIPDTYPMCRCVLWLLPIMIP